MKRINLSKNNRDAALNEIDDLSISLNNSSSNIVYINIMSNHLRDLVDCVHMQYKIIDKLKHETLGYHSLEAIDRWLPIFKDVSHDPVLKDAMDKILVYWELKHGKKV